MQNRGSPAAAGAEYVAVTETATCGESLEGFQLDAPGQDVAHVDIDRGEAGTRESGSHFHLAVDTLFAQDGDPGPGALGLDVGRGDIFVQVETQFGVQAGIAPGRESVEFLLRALRVVAQGLHAVAGFRPGREQLGALLVEHRNTFTQDADAILGVGAADDIELVAQAGRKAGLHDGGRIGAPHLQDGAEFLVEQNAEQAAGIGFARVGSVFHVLHDVVVQTVIAQFIDIQIHAAMAGEGHFTDRREQPAIGAVMVGEQLAFLVQALDQREKGFQLRRLIQVGTGISQLAMDLAEDAAAQSILATPEIKQNQIGCFAVIAQLRRQCASGIRTRREGGDDQRQRRDNGFIDQILAPTGAHRHGILADRDADAQFRTQRLANRMHGIEQRGVFAGMTCGGHPVGR